MKPIKLKIKGLNSYREEQVIDFENLLVGGVFGIFGPTGSGKSTILDGIAIALYGYEAIPRDTKDFINTDCEKAYIYFEFELITDSGRNRFIVERSIKESKNGGIATDFSRLIKVINGENEIVEDKVSSINHAIVELLGLEAKDFLRSVVLPQGKFSEFLQLKNKARCDMLERILGLQKYGERLSKKIAENRNLVKLELSAKQGELKRYEGVSELALKELRDEQLQIESNIASIQKEISTLNSSIEENRAIIKNQKELSKYDREHKALLLKGKDINQLRIANEGYEKSLILNPIVRELSSNNADIENNREQINKLIKNLAEEELNLKNKEKELELLKIWRENELPQLSRMQIKLEEVIKIDNDLEVLEKERQELVQDYKTANNEVAKRESIITNSRKQLDELEKKIELADKEIANLSMDNTYRNSIIEGMNAIKNSDMAREKHKELSNRLVNLKESIDKNHQKYTLVNEKINILNENIEKSSNELDTMENKNKECMTKLINIRDNENKLGFKVREVEDSLKKVEIARAIHKENKLLYKELLLKQEYNTTKAEQNKNNLDALIKEIEGLRNSQSAGLLAQTLIEEKSCPVCGSNNHPHKAEVIDFEEIEKLESLKKDYDLDRLEIQKSTFDLEAQLVITESKRTTALRDIDELLPNVEGINIEELKKEYLELTKQIKENEEMIKEYKESIPRLTKEKKQLIDQVSLQERDLKELKSALDTDKIKLEHTKSEVENLSTQITEYKKIQKSIMDALVIEDILTEFKQIKYKDERHEILAKELKQSNEELDLIRKKIKNSEDEIRLFLTKRDVAEKLGKSKKEDINKKKDEINKVTKGAKPKKLLEEVNQSIVSQKNEYDNTVRAVEQLKITLEEYKTGLANLKTSNKMMEDIIKKNRNRLEEELSRLGILKFDGKLIDTISKELYIKNKSDIKLFEDNMQIILSNIERLNILLKGKKSDERENDILVTKLKESVESHKTLLESKGSITRKITDMNKSLEILKSIIDEEKRLDARLTMLNELFTLIKGKRFVEFIAISRLKYISKEASSRLMNITNNRFSLELDSKGGFIICDNFNGGVRRDSNSLSGGETFLTSLALALSLSSHIQLKSSSSIEFFFMDEGFGTLDNQLLDMVMSSLERLGEENLSVGIISHVKEIKDRVEVKIIVEPAEAGVSGTQIRVER